MAKQFWVRHGGQVSGPYTATQLKQMGASGQVTPADEISPDQARWIPARKVSGLFPADAAAPEPPATPAAKVPGVPAPAPGLYDDLAPAPAPPQPPNAPVEAPGLYDDRGAPAVPAIAARPRRKSRKGPLLLVVVVALAAGGAGFWYFWPWQVNRAMKYAPPGTIGIIHVDLDALVADAISEMKKHKDKMPGMDWDKVQTSSEKVASMDVYLVDQGAGGPPGPFVVLHGTLQMKDIDEAFKSAGELPVAKGANGRYDLAAGPMAFRLVFGDEADDVPAGVVMGGPAAMVTAEFIKKLGTGEAKALRKALRGVNARAPIWGAFVSPDAAGQGAPMSVAGHSDPRKGGKTRVEMTFRTAADAKRAESQMKNTPAPFAGMFEVERDGKVVVVKADHEQSLFGKLFQMIPPMAGRMPVP